MNGAPTELALDGGTTYLTIPSGKAFFFTAKVFGIRSDGGAYASFFYRGTIQNVGTATTMAAGVLPVVADENLYGCALLIDRNDAGDYLSIKVTNPSSSEIWRWTAHVEGLELAYGTT